MSGELHICPQCESRLVQLRDSKKTETWQQWHLSRQCPECGWRGEGVHGRAECVAFDRALSAGFKSLHQASEVLERESFRDFAEVFLGALAADVVGPEDFGRS